MFNKIDMVSVFVSPDALCLIESSLECYSRNDGVDELIFDNSAGDEVHTKIIADALGVDPSVVPGCYIAFAV